MNEIENSNILQKPIQRNILGSEKVNERGIESHGRRKIFFYFYCFLSFFVFIFFFYIFGLVKKYFFGKNSKIPWFLNNFQLFCWELLQKHIFGCNSKALPRKFSRSGYLSLVSTLKELLLEQLPIFFAGIIIKNM